MTLNEWGLVIQSGSTFFLVVVTLIYVFLTRKMLYSPYRPFLRPTSANSSGAIEWRIKLRNIGNGHALDVQLMTIEYKTGKLCNADGSHEIASFVETDYSFANSLIQSSPEFKYPFFIRYRSTTGKVERTNWLILGSNHDKIIPLGFLNWVKFKLNPAPFKR